MTWLENLDRAAGAGVCTFLANGGNAALGSAIVGAALVPGGQLPALGAGLGLIALNSGCAFDPNASTPEGELGGFCREVVGGTVKTRITLTSLVLNGEHLRLDSVAIGPADNPTQARPYAYRFSGRRLDGTEVIDKQLGPWEEGAIFESWGVGGDCSDVAPPAPPPVPPPYDYDGQPNNECNITVEFLAWDVRDDGRVAPVLKMTPTAPAAGARADDPVVSGCNFSPVIYVGNPEGPEGGPPRVIPWTPGPDGPDGSPWWVEPVSKGKDCPSLKEVERLINERLPGSVPGKKYVLRSVCEVDSSGNPAQQVIEKDVPAGASIQAVVDRLDALPDLLQGLKDFKQPTCAKVPKAAGQQVTVRFLQVGTGLTRPLDKILRYRALGGADLGAHTAHWEDFQWDAGPVCVISKGLPWGVPQVWAASEAEGKRVIQHAAAIAGVNLDSPDHEWIVTASSGIRTGRTGRMAIDRRRGVLGVSARPGSSGMPLRAVDVAPHLAP